MQKQSIYSFQFPEFHLEDKVLVWGDGNVRHYTQQPKALKSFTRSEKKNDLVKDNVVIPGDTS